MAFWACVWRPRCAVLCGTAIIAAVRMLEIRDISVSYGGRRRQLAGTLSGGEQQMLAIGRGIASEPRLLLLDEPSMGLAPAVADLIFDRIAELHRDSGVTLLLVEQRVAEALESCDYGYVLETGGVALQGTHTALMADERVRRAYLRM